MADFDLEEMSLQDLKQLEKEVAKAISSFESRRKKEAWAAAEAAVREMGYSLSELATDLKNGKSVPKYQNPEQPDQTWTGRGRKPTWFVEALEHGKTLEDLQVG